MKRRILIATSTRADWGLLSPVARRLRRRPDCEVMVMATNMHLDTSRGNTLAEIRTDGFDPLIAPMPVGFDTGEAAARAAGACMASAAEVMGRVGPDVAVLLGDRFEIAAIAQAAVIMRVPLVHISGGEVTAGAFDDCFRHSITKMAALHLTATEPYRRRVIQLGEDPSRVINAGSLGVMNMAAEPLMDRSSLEADLEWEFGSDALLVTLHPETMSDLPADVMARAMFEALDRFPSSRLLVTYPNNDPAGDRIIKVIEDYAASAPSGRVRLVPSLGRRRYHSALRCVRAVVGNSSSGIVEVPSAGIPTVDIGSRQQGRIAASSVIHCAPDPDSIAGAVARALAMDCRGIVNPYSRPDTLDIVERAIAETPLEMLRSPKVFYDNI